MIFQDGGYDSLEHLVTSLFIRILVTQCLDLVDVAKSLVKRQDRGQITCRERIEVESSSKMMVVVVVLESAVGNGEESDSGECYETLH